MKTWLALVLAGASVVRAELRPLSDDILHEISGQSGITIEISGQITYDAILYNGEVISTSNPSSSDGRVREVSIHMDGYTLGMPNTGGILDLFSLFLPISFGEVDTDGDGVRDRGAAVFNFRPNVGVPVTPISIRPEDTTLSIDDQVFVTKQGIVFLNAPLSGDYNIGGQTYQYQHPSRLF